MATRHRRSHLCTIERLETRELLSLLTATKARDGVPGSLRAVIARAHAGDEIRFAPGLGGANIPLTQGELLLDKSLTIRGSGQIIDAGGRSRVLYVRGPGVGVTIRDVTISGGRAALDPYKGSLGGGILVADAGLNLERCTIRDNRAVSGRAGVLDGPFVPAAGGAIFVTSGSLTLTRCILSANQALGGRNTSAFRASEASGGGIYAEGSTVTIVGGSIRSNLARGGNATVGQVAVSMPMSGGQASGGAIFLRNANIAISRTDVSANLAIGGDGHNQSRSPGDLSPGYGGDALGGAIYADDLTGVTQTISLRRVRFVGNRAKGGAAGAERGGIVSGVTGGQAFGGAIYHSYGSFMTIDSSTFSGNQAIGGAAGPSGKGLGSTVGFGGDAGGGSIYSLGVAGVNASGVIIKDSLARGGNGPNSGKSANASAAGNAVGGAWELYNQSRRLFVLPVIPFALRDARFIGNRALSGSDSGSSRTRATGGQASGGALGILGPSELTLENVEWACNTAMAGPGREASGGALFLASFSPTPARIIRGSFSRNRAIGGTANAQGVTGGAIGGAIANQFTDLVVSSVSFTDNAALSPGASRVGGLLDAAQGGALYQFGSSLVLEDGNFAGNLASSAGKAEALGGAILLDAWRSPTSTFSINGVTIRSNRALAGWKGQGFGGGIAFLDNPRVNMISTVVRRNHASTTGPNLFGQYQPTSTA